MNMCRQVHKGATRRRSEREKAKRNEKMCSEVHNGAARGRGEGEKEMRKCVVQYTKERLDEEDKGKKQKKRKCAVKCKEGQAHAPRQPSAMGLVVRQQRAKFAPLILSFSLSSSSFFPHKVRFGGDEVSTSLPLRFFLLPSCPLFPSIVLSSSSSLNNPEVRFGGDEVSCL